MKLDFQNVKSLILKTKHKSNTIIKKQHKKMPNFV